MEDEGGGEAGPLRNELNVLTLMVQQLTVESG